MTQTKETTEELIQRINRRIMHLQEELEGMIPEDDMNDYQQTAEYITQCEEAIRIIHTFNY